MSKIFKSALIQYGDRTLTVKEHAGHVNVTVRDPEATFGATVSSADAPALALAILDAAPGPDHVRDGSPEAMLAIAHGQLRRAVDAFATEAEAKAKGAADQKVLEAEAFTLYSAAPFTSGVHSFELLSDGAKVQWLSIARASRDLHGGTK